MCYTVKDILEIEVAPQDEIESAGLSKIIQPHLYQVKINVTLAN